MTQQYNGTFRVAAVEQPLIFEPCVYDQPPCPGCRRHDVCGGIGYKFFTTSVQNILQSKPVFVKATGWGQNDGPGSIYNLLLRSEADISQMAMTLTHVRSLYLQPTYPIMYTRYVAVIKTPMGQPSNLDISAATGIFFLTLLILYLIFYGMSKTVTSRAAGHSYQFTVRITNLATAIFNLFLAACFAYFGSAVTILFYERPPTLPFTSFSTLAQLLLSKEFKPLVIYNITVENIFLRPNGGKLSKMLADSYKINKPTVIDDIDEAIVKVLSSSNLEKFVLIIPSDYSLAIMEAKYRDFVVIEDTNELPWEMHGFYLTEGFDPKLDWYKREIMLKEFYYWTQYYISQNRSHAHESATVVSEKLSQTVQFEQVQIVFYLLVAGFVISVLCLGLEKLCRVLINKTSVRPGINCRSIKTLIQRSLVIISAIATNGNFEVGIHDEMVTTE